MKVMISQPMNGRSQEDIQKERQGIVEKFKQLHIEVVETLFTDEPPKGCNEALYYLGKSISAMKDIDAIYMCPGWGSGRGCCIEHEVARQYNIKILYDNFFYNDNEPITNTIERFNQNI